MRREGRSAQAQVDCPCLRVEEGEERGGERGGERVSGRRLGHLIEFFIN